MDIETKGDTEKRYMAVPFEVKAEDIKEDGTFSGYGSLFDKKPDAYRDIISPGAFAKTLKAGGHFKSGIAMLWQHQRDSLPGVWASLEEDKKGLKSSGRLALASSLGNDVYQIMKLGAELGTFKLGQSIGYSAVQYEIDEKKRIRVIKEIDLWELSIVTFPAKLGATVNNVKNIEEAGTEREMEQALRDAGLSKNASKYVVKLCRPSLREAGVVTGLGALSGILDSLKEVNTAVGKSFEDALALEEEKVIPFHSYRNAPPNTTWDGSEEVKKADTDQLVRMATWFDSTKPDVKASYKLTHHKAGSFTTIWRGVTNAMAKLLQPGTQIPSTERRGVYDHLVKHYKEFDKEPPAFKDYDNREWKNVFPVESMIIETDDSISKMICNLSLV